MLTFNHVNFSYNNGECAISDVSFEIGRGEFTALLGENGAGKSTLCRLCNGLLKPDAGKVTAAGFDTRAVKTSIIAGKVGFLFQNPDRQICQATVREEILFGLEFAGISPDTAEKRCKEMLSLFELDGLKDPFGLSRGERQQVALASVLAREPELLILDEPTTGLDYRECMRIMDIVDQMNKSGATVLMISHDMEVVLDFARRALILSGGKLIGDGTVHDIMRDSGTLASASLLPAQIPGLSCMLGGEFYHIDSTEELAEAAERIIST